MKRISKLSILMVTFVPFMILSKSFVLYKIWEWFLSSIFGSDMSFIEAIGIVGISMILTSIKNKDKDILDKLDVTNLLSSAIFPYIVLGVFYIMKLIFV